MRLKYCWVFLCFLFLQSKRSCFPKLDAIKSATADIVSQFVFLCLYVCALQFLNYSFFLLFHYMCSHPDKTFSLIKADMVNLLWKVHDDNLIDAVPHFVFDLFIGQAYFYWGGNQTLDVLFSVNHFNRSPHCFLSH